MPNRENQAGEELLRAWLRLSAVISSRRLVSGMTFNQAIICNHLLYQEAHDPEHPLTATDLCEKTALLKSQMNGVLMELEKKGYITRSRRDLDRRQVSITITEQGRAAYEASHQRASGLLTPLVGRIGLAETESLTQRLNEVNDILLEIQKEKQKGTL